MEETRIRRRVNVSTSVKGVVTFEATVETDNLSLEDHMKLQDELFNECVKRYPPNKEG